MYLTMCYINSVYVFDYVLYQQCVCIISTVCMYLTMCYINRVYVFDYVLYQQCVCI